MIDLEKIILDYKNQLNLGITNGLKIEITKKYHNLIIAGMGGSVVSSYLLKQLASEISLKNQKKIFIIEDFENNNLNQFNTKDSLLIISSYSGDTQETLTIFKEALRRKFKIIVLTNGGKLKKLANRSNLDILEIIESPSPRYSSFYLLGVFTAIFDESLANKLKNTAINQKLIKKQVIQLTKFIKNDIILLYHTKNTYNLSKIFELFLNETSKNLTFNLNYPQTSHYQLIALDYNNKINFKALIINDQDLKISKKLEILKKFYKNQLKIETQLVSLSTNPFKRIIETLFLAQLLSYNLALVNKIDPLDIKIQELFKRELDK